MRCHAILWGFFFAMLHCGWRVPDLACGIPIRKGPSTSLSIFSRIWSMPCLCCRLKGQAMQIPSCPSIPVLINSSSNQDETAAVTIPQYLHHGHVTACRHYSLSMHTRLASKRRCNDGLVYVLTHLEKVHAQWTVPSPPICSDGMAGQPSADRVEYVIGRSMTTSSAS